MKKPIAFAFAAIAASVFADRATFPYETDMTRRITTDETVSVSDSQAELTGTPTGESDTVAELIMTAVTFTAIEASEWDAFVSGIESPSASLAIKSSAGVLSWYGFAGSAWVELTDGPEIDLDASYDVRISFDKTVGDRIRYSVRTGEGAWVDLAYGGSVWLDRGSAAPAQLSKVVLKGTGSVGTAALESGARGAYADISGVVQKYSFDYSNVVFTVNVGDGAYGDKLKITLDDGSGVKKTVEQDLVKGANTVDFSDKSLVPGAAYDCTIEVVKTDVGSDRYAEAKDVTLAATADWFGYAGGDSLLKASGSNITIADGTLSPTDESQPAVVTPDGSSSANSRSTVEITVDYTDAFAETAQFDDAQSALALTEEGWKCLADGGWKVISNADVPTAAGVYATRAEFDYTVKPGKVRFSVKDNDAWHVMKNNETEWFDLVGSDNRLNGTSFVGGGKISAISATYSSVEGIDPAVSGTTVTLAGSTDVKLRDMAAGAYSIVQPDGRVYSMKWTDADGKRATIKNGQLVVTDASAVNGLQSYDSYALGLDAGDAASKPVLDSVQNAATDKLTMKVANVVPNTEVADVTMKLVTMDAPDAATGTETPIAAGEGVQIDLPGGVKYYKVKISIKTK